MEKEKADALEMAAKENEEIKEAAQTEKLVLTSFIFYSHLLK
jgi:hypothetical protein